MVWIILALLGGAFIGYVIAALLGASAWSEFRNLVDKWRYDARGWNPYADDLERLLNGDRTVLEVKK